MTFILYTSSGVLLNYKQDLNLVTDRIRQIHSISKIFLTMANGKIFLTMANGNRHYFFTVNNTPCNGMCCQVLRMLLFCTGWKLLESFLLTAAHLLDNYLQVPSVREGGAGKPVGHSGENSFAVARTWHRPYLLGLNELHTFTVPECNAKHPSVRGHSKYAVLELLLPCSNSRDT